MAAVGGIENVDFNSVSSWVAALLFEDAAKKATANGGTLSRQSLFDALKQETTFDAGGIIGATDFANHMPSPCIVMTQIKDGKFVRTYPTKVGHVRLQQEEHRRDEARPQLICSRVASA